jgi:putative ABC transport system ATP-binding protein
MLTDKLSVERVSLTITENEKPITLLNDVSLTTKAGRIHALLGPSGSGKSTLLYTLNRLREITSGQIAFKGTDIRSLNVLDLRRQIGLVMQKAIFFPGTVEENILFGPRLRAKLEQSLQSKSIPDPKYFLQLVGLEPDWVSRNPNTLSGGQQQRVSLARTLANEPEILLLDEPTAALDAQASLHLEELISRLCIEHQLTVLWVTHDIHQAKRVAHDMTLLYKGQVIEQGEATSFFKNPQTEKGQEYLAGKLEGGV